MKITVYTDASFSHTEKVAACGFVVMRDEQIIKHEVILFSNCESTKCAEVLAAINAIQYCFLIKDVKEIVLYTDYINILKYGRKAIKKYYYYKELSETIEVVKEHNILLSINHVKAHSGDKINSLVDSSSRKQLRNYIKKISVV